MKRLKIKAFAFILFILVLFLLTLLKLNFVDALYFYSNERFELNKIPFVAGVSLILTLLLILFFEKRFDFWTGFNFAWVFGLVFLFNLVFITYHDYKVLDYFFAEKLHRYKVDKFNEESWIDTRFIIDQDTLYYDQNEKMKKIYDGDYDVFKSRFQKYYYLKIPE